MLSDPTRLITSPANAALYSFDHENPFAMQDGDGNDPHSWVGRTGAFVTQTIATTHNAAALTAWRNDRLLGDMSRLMSRQMREEAHLQLMVDIQNYGPAILAFPNLMDMMQPGLGGADGAVIESTVVDDAVIDDVVIDSIDPVTEPPATPSAQGEQVGVDAAGASAPKSAYDVAQSGGRHAGFLKNYLGKATAEIQRGISSLERQVAEHEAKIAEPEKAIENWSKLDPRQQAALVNKKWPSDIARQKELIEVLKGILGGGK